MSSIGKTLAVIFAVGAAPVVHAQTLVVGGAVQRDVQRFSEDVVPNRLDGAASGWTALAAIFPIRHVAVALEWSDAGTIRDVRATALDIDGRAVTITSTFAHQTRALLALAGYTHGVSSRGRLSYLVGAAVTRVRRTFNSDAPAAVLVRPSDRSVSASSAVSDRFTTIAGGVDAFVRIAGDVHLVAGTRAEKLALSPDLSGWSVRTMVGAGWAF